MVPQICWSTAAYEVPSSSAPELSDTRSVSSRTPSCGASLSTTVTESLAYRGMEAHSACLEKPTPRVSSPVHVEPTRSPWEESMARPPDCKRRPEELRQPLMRGIGNCSKGQYRGVRRVGIRVVTASGAGRNHWTAYALPPLTCVEPIVVCGNVYCHGVRLGSANPMDAPMDTCAPAVVATEAEAAPGHDAW